MNFTAHHRVPNGDRYRTSTNVVCKQKVTITDESKTMWVQKNCKFCTGWHRTESQDPDRWATINFVADRFICSSHASCLSYIQCQLLSSKSLGFKGWLPENCGLCQKPCHNVWVHVRCWATVFQVPCSSRRGEKGKQSWIF